MTEEIIIAGFGGQGVLVLGQMLTYAAMLEEKHTSWFPSYGPEQRGGTCNCSVVISNQVVGSPVVSEPTTAVVMNLPSLHKFAPRVQPGGVLLINSSLVSEKPSRDDIQVVQVPANEIADELGETRVANMVALGALLAVKPVVSPDSVVNSMEKVLPARRQHLIPLNRQALERGREYVRNLRGQ